MIPHIDLVYATVKGYSSLRPLYAHMEKTGWSVSLQKVHKHRFRNRRLLRNISETIIIAYDQPLNRLRSQGWQGKFIYIEHGLSPVKYYTYKYEFFQQAELLFYPGEIFQRKMLAINPEFQRGLLGGYPKMDELVSMTVDREALCREYDLDPHKPIILFAPSWGGKQDRNAGIHNARHLNGLENLIIVPHSADYRFAKQYASVKPAGGNINPLLILADIVVSDVSSVLAEASILDKPVVQVILPYYPGCYPEEDKRTEGIWISDEILQREQQTDRTSRPFKIPYVDEDWIMGHSARPEDLQAAIMEALEKPEKFEEARRYWSAQSCWKADGRSSERIAAMVSHFLTHDEARQLE